jgi:asparagine synthase (glutamine-hydrolysing)
MCGFIGIYNLKEAAPVNTSVLRAMNDSIAHRGPDQSGEYFDDFIGLGHRRLSIIDLSNGKQPLFNEDNSVVIVYNGEIYNFQELEKELKGLGHKFGTRCDTEVIVHAWEEWGEACVKRFNGMFAFALWDMNKKLLFLARDHLGIKPLFYSLQQGKLLFGSELKALLKYPNFNKAIDPHAIEEYFAYGYIPDPRSIFKNVWKLPAGQTLVVPFGASNLPEPKSYWDLSFKPLAQRSEREYQEEIISRLKASVKSQLITEVPLGAFISGGVDSSSVVAMMALLSKENVSRENPEGSVVNTCSISFEEEAYNEEQYALMVTNRYKTNHHVETVKGESFDIVDKLASLYDEPYADSSAIATYRLCEIVRKKVTVALSGDGGDENFAGYKSYRTLQNLENIRSRIPESIRRPIFGTLGSIYPKADWAPRIFRAKRTFEKLAENAIDAFAHGSMISTNYERMAFFSEELSRDLQGYDAVNVFRLHARNAPTHDLISQAQYVDFKVYLPSDILTKVDRASMAHSLEVRVPILDHTFVDWVSGIPYDLKLNKTEGKYIFKKSLEPYLPQEVLYRSKMGFTMPVSEWIRGPLKDKVYTSIRDGVLKNTGFFNHKQLSKLLYEHESKARNHGSLIWALFQFEQFCNKVV